MARYALLIEWKQEHVEFGCSDFRVCAFLSDARSIELQCMAIFNDKNTVASARFACVCEYVRM